LITFNSFPALAKVYHTFNKNFVKKMSIILFEKVICNGVGTGFEGVSTHFAVR